MKNRNEILELSQELIQKNKIVKIQAGGKSMFPCLKEGDICYIKKVTPDELRCGDLIVFRTTNRFVVHRLHKIHTNYLITKGDNLFNKDRPLSLDKFWAKVISIEHKSKKQDLDSPKQKTIQFFYLKLSFFIPYIYSILKWIKKS